MGFLSKLFGVPDKDAVYPYKTKIAKVAGVSYKNDDGSDRQEIIYQCHRGDVLTLEHQPHNPHDSNAVAVFQKSSGGQIGFLKRGLAAYLVRTIERGDGFSAKILEITGGFEYSPTLGVRIEISLYKL